MKARLQKIRLTKDVPLMGWITLKQDTIYEAIKINATCAYIAIDGREIRILGNSFERVRGGKKK